MIIQKPRGTYDLFGEEIEIYEKICGVIKRICKLYNCKEIQTPIFEHKELFVRNIGESSDIVTKEFYDFKDKSNRDLALRPENTVSVIRSVIENKLIKTQPLPIKFFYIGPMFRYERPQSGRARQFHQFGIEYIGIKNIYSEVETIQFAKQVLDELKIFNYDLKINYIGSLETRQKWIEALKKYFTKFTTELSQDSINRLDKNPLRILDDKVDGQKDFVKKAPKITDFLSHDEKKEFDLILTSLNALKMKYQVDLSLVRGLDYYSGLVYEFVSNSNQLKGQSTIVGGGKYTGLTKELGDVDQICTGFAMGIERLIIAYKDENKLVRTNQVDFYFAAIGDSNSEIKALEIIEFLRKNNFSVESNFELKKLDKQFKYGEKFNPKVVLIYGDNDFKNNTITLKVQATKENKTVLVKDFLSEVIKKSK